MKEIASIRNAAAKRSFEVQVSKTEFIAVDANNRAQAAAIVRKLGYSVCSVNAV